MKKLLAVFLVTSLIVLAEMSYLLYLYTTNTAQTKNTKPPAKTEEPLIETNVIGYLKSRTKNSGQKLTLQEEVIGIIKDIVYEKPGQMTVDIADIQGKKILNLILPIPLDNYNSPQHKFLLDKNGVRTPIIDSKEIKIGRKIRKTANVDLIDGSKNTSETIIYVN